MRGSLARSLLSMVVPPLCVACREPELSGAPVCVDCVAQLPAIGSCCRHCGAPRPCPVDACSECRGRGFAFERAWAPFVYAGPARALVVGLKGRGFTDAAPYMAGAIARRAPPRLLRGALVPAPAHPERMRRHGANQARALAGAIGRATGLPVCDVLARRPGGTRQVGLERHARQVNARGWIVARGGIPGGAPAVLVDDVYTTGSTLDACAAALKAGGAGPVAAVCFARTVRAPPGMARGPGGA
jgi:predicted amidophosphoribosyltransferase